MLQMWLAITQGDPGKIRRPDPGVSGPALIAYDGPLGPAHVLLALYPETLAARSLVRHDAHLEVRIGKCHAALPLPDACDDDDPRLTLDATGGRLELTLPVTATMQLFATGTGKSLYVSTDPRWLYDPTMQLDPRGLYALLQFGTLVPPYSCWREIRRLQPGHRATLHFDPPLLKERPAPCWQPPASAETPPPTPEEQEDLVAEVLDACLRRLSPDCRPVVLFSGGVDSSLLAARAAALGWNDTLLANYSMGPDDHEGKLARKIAAHLGLPFRSLTDDPDAWDQPLERLARDYPQPLGDYSLVPTWRLARRVQAEAGTRCCVLDGTGADAIFRTFPKLARWQRLYRLPRPARLVASGLYAPLDGWLHDSRAGRRLGAARTSLQLPFLLGSMISENPLAGIAYDFPGRLRREVHAAITAGIAACFALPGEAMDSRGLDLRHVVCDLTGQKDAPLFLGQPLDIAYPFLVPPIVRLGLQEAIRWPGADESKAVLKRLLARHLPAEWIYRPKRGFTPPIARGLRAPGPQAALHEVVLAASNPLRPFLKMRTISRMVAGTAAGRPLPHTTYNFIWTLLATSLWLDQFGRQPPVARAHE
ncbi:MAG: hypothetical protein KAY32_05085 [Candidatus Eisenbacteria sp.]|nr:hypothetical protein [Candidatus Eisenbacteria bacterium]